MKLFHISGLLLAALLASPTVALADRIHEIVVTTDGSEYAGYISHQDMNTGQITVKADYLIRSLSPNSCKVGEERTVPFSSLPAEAQEWCRNHNGGAELTSDAAISVRDVQETFGARKLWRDAFIIEEGSFIKFVVFGGSFPLEADKVKTIRHNERPADATEGVVDVFMARGLNVSSVEGQLVEENVGESFRVLQKGGNGTHDRIVNISAANVISRSKRPLNPAVSLYRQAPLIDEVHTANGESIVGVVATMDMDRGELVVVTEAGVSRIVKIDDVVAIATAPSAEAYRLHASSAPLESASAAPALNAEVAAPTASASAPTASAPVTPPVTPATVTVEPPFTTEPVRVNLSPEVKPEVKLNPKEEEKPEVNEIFTPAPEEEEVNEPEETEDEVNETTDEDPEEQFFESDEEDDEGEVTSDDEDDEEYEEVAADEDEEEEEAVPGAPQKVPVPEKAAKTQFYVSKKAIAPCEAILLPNGYWSMQGECVAVEHKGNDAYIEVPAGVPSNDAIEVYALSDASHDGKTYPNSFSPAEGTKVARVKVASSQRPVPGYKRITFQLPGTGRYAIYRPADKMVMWFEWK